MQDIVFPIAELLEWTFGFLPMLGNLPNIAFILVGFALLIYWIKEMVRYNKEAEQNGTLK
jgi:hypothetical protein